MINHRHNDQITFNAAPSQEEADEEVARADDDADGKRASRQTTVVQAPSPNEEEAPSNSTAPEEDVPSTSAAAEIQSAARSDTSIPRLSQRMAEKIINNAIPFTMSQAQAKIFKPENLW